MREATREHYGPRVYSQHINLHLLYFCRFLFAILLNQKYKKYKLSYLSDLTLISNRKGIDTYRVGCEVLICLCRCEGLAHGLLLD